MINKDTKNKGFSPVLPLLVVILSVLLSYWVISPKIFSIRVLNTNISAKDKDMSALNEKIQNLKVLQTQFTKSPQDVELLKMAIVSDQQMPELIEELTAIGNKSGMQIKSLRPNYDQTSDDSIISITLKGNYINLIGFATYLEKNLRPATIKSINMNSSDTTGGKSFDATVSMAFFTLKDQVSTAQSSGAENGGSNE